MVMRPVSSLSLTTVPPPVDLDATAFPGGERKKHPSVKASAPIERNCQARESAHRTENEPFSAN